MFIKSTVFIVDDCESICRSVMMLCKSQGLEAEAFKSPYQFLAEYNTATPGCLLLDLRMPDLDGIGVLEKLLQKDIHLPVVIISGHADVSTCVRAMKLGAMDVIQKPFQNQVLMEAIEKALARDLEIRAEKTAFTCARACFDSLAQREKEVLQWICQGLTNKEIAHKLEVCPKTIEYHRKKIMHKMNAQSIVELVRICDRLTLASN